MLPVTSWSTTRFALKHVLAATATIASMVVCAAVWSLVTVVMMAARDRDVAFPANTLYVLAAGVAAVVLVLAPITIATEILTRRAGLRVWWQIPISLAMLLLVGSGLSAVGVGSGQVLPVASQTAAIATAALVIPLAMYWWALQSADWLLRAGGQMASRMSPRRFASLANSTLTHGGRSVEVRAQFRLRQHFGFAAGTRTNLVLVGDIESGVIQKGMLVFAGTRSPLTATIASVEYVDNTTPARSHVGLMLAPMSDDDLSRWQDVATEGAILRIA